jgi:hypothetical protein
MAPGCASVLVHVVNPYGMAWLRRVNERGVDLNRNCLGAGETYAGAPPGYDRLDQFLNPVPRRASTPYYLQAGWLIVRYGIPHLKQAIAGGQHVNPAGLFFGGRSLEQGPRELSRFVHERLAAVEYLIGIDVHTGLGPFGTDTLLVNADERSRSFTRLREAFGERVSLSDPRRSPAYRATGTYDTIFRRAAPGAGVDFVVQEFGTYSSLRVLKVLRAENLRHRQGDEGIDHPTKVDLRETFCPSDESWRMAVLTRGGAAIGQALGLLAGKKSD